MLERLVANSIAQRWLVLLVVIGVVLLGLYNYARLPIDAVPDITNVQVQINTDVPGYSALEAEQRITFPVETAMAGLPRLDYTRSISRYGLSQVTVVFEDGTDIYLARQLVSERLAEVRGRLPSDVESVMGPIATGRGEIFMYALSASADTSMGSGRGTRLPQWVWRRFPTSCRRVTGPSGSQGVSTVAVRHAGSTGRCGSGSRRTTACGWVFRA